MTREQRNRKILDAIEAETTRALATKKTAREILIKEGIYTVSGKLRAEFGGKNVKKKLPATA